jgi:myo-inositol-1(or 4)-monophosphatase
VDKKSLLSKSFSEVMAPRLPEIQHLVDLHGQAEVQHKGDGSPVTALDLALSELIEDICSRELSDFTFYSEEKFSDWSFPLMALDPLDGTREFIAGRPEWAISVGLFLNDYFVGEGWIYNPLTNELFSEQSIRNPVLHKDLYRGEVSRAEWETGLFNIETPTKFHLIPMGSIAYKLGKLSAGLSDFVISKKPKNIWDIAGGTVLCRQAGYSFYSQGQLVTKVKPYYDAPLIWCHESLFPELSETFS